MVGGALGAAGGAGLAASEAHGKPIAGGSLDERRQSIEKREAEGSKGGIRGFVQAFDLAKDKAMLSLGEYTKENPTAATIGGGVLGGITGALAGPAIAKGIGKARESQGKLTQAVGESFGKA
jgi:hypothetical protein